MFCTHCKEQIEEGARFCPKCGKPIGVQPASLAPEEREKEQQIPQENPMAAGGEGPLPPKGPDYPYYAPVSPGMVPPKKKNGWIIPVLIVVGVLLIGLIFVGALLGYSVYKTISNEGYFLGDPIAETGKMGDLEPFFGRSMGNLEKEKGLLLIDQGDGSYANLNGSIAVYENSDGDIDQIVLSGKDTGFSLCGVSIGMSKEEAFSQVSAYLGDGEIYEDMVVSQSEDRFHFAAWFDETGIIDYIMCFSDVEEMEGEDDTITMDSGVWYLGETFGDAWEWFGTEYTVDNKEYSTGIYYAQRGLYFSTTQLPYTQDSVISYVAFDQGACFVEDLYVGMTYTEWLAYVDLGEIEVDNTTGGYVSYFTVSFDGRECYGAVSFDAPEPTAKSTAAFFKSDELM